MLQVDSLSRAFGDLKAVDGVSFEVQDGEIFGLLGPNGAGKTTTLSMACGVLRPDAGRVLVDGHDIFLEPHVVKRSLGVVPQEIAVYEDLTAADNLSFWGSLYGLRGAERRRRVAEVVSRVGLSDRVRDRVATYSGGMKRRLNLAMGLLHHPRLLLLDEPTVGIDPQARLNILDIVREVAAAGTAILYTTHYMDEAERLCDRLAIIDHGRILTQGSLDELKRRAEATETVRVSGRFSGEQARGHLEALEGVDVHTVEDGLAVLSTRPGGPGLGAILPPLLHGGLEVDDVSVQGASLESIFIRLTGRQLRD